MSDWHPIETAPKDGRRLLMFSEDEDYEDCDLTPQIGLWRDGQWLIAWDFTPMDGDVFKLPTHWMPLPEPPVCVDM